MSDGAARRVRAQLDAGDYRGAHDAALQALGSRPDDAELLVLAGCAGVELGREDAVEQLQRATALQPDNAEAWHHLGEALATEGRMEEAGNAFRRAVELNPNDQLALTHLGHTAYATGNDEEAVSLLSQAADSARGTSTAAISLVDMYRTLGQYDEALAQARRIGDADPDDIMTQLDIAELSLTVGKFDDSLAAFGRLRELESVPENEVYPLQGMLRVELAREDWANAAALAEQVAALEPQGVASDVSAFLRAQAGGDDEPADPDEPPPPTREEVDAALAASLHRYRRMHADDRRLAGEDILG
jgi:tetratricopeptide (TPR) repeat protein